MKPQSVLISFLQGALAAAAVAAAASTFAKLPPLSDEQKATAEEAKAKAAYGAKRDAYDLCRSMDRVALAYLTKTRAGGQFIAPTPTPACQDPGPPGGH
jgi:hypothetical protein